MPLDPVALQNLAALLQHLPRPTTTVTTLPDLSSSTPHFEDSPKQDVKVWLEHVRRVQQLASWEGATTRLIATSKLKGQHRRFFIVTEFLPVGTTCSLLVPNFCAKLHRGTPSNYRENYFFNSTCFGLMMMFYVTGSHVRITGSHVSVTGFRDLHPASQ